jgi:hypothetical protein
MTGRRSGCGGSACGTSLYRTPGGVAFGCAIRQSCRIVYIDIETCCACGGPVWVIASIEDPVLIEKILAHVGAGQAPMPSLLVLRPEPRAPPGPEG